MNMKKPILDNQTSMMLHRCLIDGSITLQFIEHLLAEIQEHEERIKILEQRFGIKNKERRPKDEF